ncbi:uncharacterized protein LTR77_000648 [Saxophila tyrrhenica]|uniref:Uncharacterized protein n=1 Tax=Saxophila tyrrhenica TaxID=1690608 RepID=A0AAV9PR71_9PEZI|nr:hypothetical protein LTR77_000648 [Saxophila tyrrhenica]
MASSTNAYTYQKPSTIATRSLVSDTKPTETPSTSSNDVDVQGKPVLQRRTTDNYEKAAAAATKANQIPATTAGSVAASTRGTAAAAELEDE